MINNKIISHRGSNISLYKQNTKQALLTAINLDFIDGIEFDVRITKDKKIVIAHDPIIDFVSNGHGFIKKIKYKKLLKYNFGTKENPSQICMLNELLDSINNNKIILIDIKEETKNYKEISDIVYNIIKKYNLNIYVASFNYDLIRYFNKKYKKCGLIIGNGLNTNKIYNHYHFNIVTYSYRNKVQKKETFLWTINELKKDLSDFYIITDNPYLFKIN